jgi:Zn-finger nucleic acid-binding protein
MSDLELPNLKLVERAASLRCPDCRRGMTPYACGDRVVEMCPSCRGIWFDAGVLSAFRKNLEKFDLTKLATTPPEGPKELRICECPRCAVPLDAHDYQRSKKIQIHRCRQCQGTWTPYSELLFLIDRVRVSQQILPHLLAIQREFSDLDREKRWWDHLRRFAEQLASRIGF